MEVVPYESEAAAQPLPKGRLEAFQSFRMRHAQVQKRVIDLVGSGMGLVLLSPLFLLIAVFIYLDDPGQVFYRQTRVGKGGRYFSMLKFRTMRPDADLVLRSYLAKDPALRREWDRYQKLEHDPRVTRFGSLLRRYSLDELPQLWNVFTGEMSLVGPRPIMPDQQDLYGSLLTHYARVTPGITGLWQISGRNKTTFARRAELDTQYVTNWSIWTDLYILACTAWVVLRRVGAA